MVFGLPISSSDLLTWGGLGFTAGTLLKQGTITKFSGYAIMGGALLWLLERVGIV
jgi:hypothetical protein